jgi:hypothetical protein
MPDAQIPLLIGVTGHRDLVPEEIAPLRVAVRSFLARLRRRFPDAPLLIVSSLSQGADLLVAEEALALGLGCCAVLPLPLALYRTDFDDALDWCRFEEVLARCGRTMVCAGDDPPGTSFDAPRDGIARSARYAAASELIAAEAFILLALWDGKPSELAGGTASTVEFRLSRRSRTEVYHVVTSRRRGAPQAGLAPLQAGYRRTFAGPLEVDLPKRAANVATRTSELDRDLRRYDARVSQSAAHDGSMGDLAALPNDEIDNAELYRSIAGLAVQMRRHAARTLLLTFALVAMIGGSLLLSGSSDGVARYRYGMMGIAAAFALLAGASQLVRSYQWYRRYREYETLAEGLRTAGRGAEPATPPAHLGPSVSQLEWIGNAIRSASLMSKAVRQSTR